MSSGATAPAGPPGTRSTGCRTAGRSRSASGRRGPSAGAQRRATTRSAPRKPGCATCSKRRRGTPAGLVQTSATFADAAAEFLRYVEHDRAIKPSTLTEYRSIVSAHLVPAFGAMRVEEVTPEKIERWRATVTSARLLAAVQPHQEQVARPAPRRLPPRPEGVRAVRQPRRGDRAPPAALERRHPGLQRRRGLRACARGHLRTGRHHLPHRRLHRAASRRARRCAGATSTSPPRPSASVRATPGAR